jgi:hypothetical protein
MRGKEIKQIGDLLARFKNLRPPQKAVIDVFCEAVRASCGVAVPRQAVRYTVATRTIGIMSAGPLKSEVAQKRAEILRYCAQELGVHAPHEIV